MTTFADDLHLTTSMATFSDELFMNATNLNVSDAADIINATASSMSTPRGRSWIYWVPGPIICGIGIFCNTLNLCVLLQKELHGSPYIYLTALSTTDLLFLTLSFIHLVISKSPQSIFKAFYDAYIFFAFGNVLFSCGVWFIVLLTVERMCFVVRPLTMRPSLRKTKLSIGLVVLVCCLINIPRFLCYKIVFHKGAFYPKGTEFRHSGMFYRTSWFYAVLINFIPLVILIVTNTTLLYTLHQAGKSRESLRSNHDAAAKKVQNRLTRTLIAVVILFFVCVTPSAFVEDPIAYALFGGSKTWSEYLKSPANQTFIYISNLLLFVNSSLNFVLYCAFNKKFRNAMKNFFGKLRRQRKKFRMSFTKNSSHDDGWHQVQTDASSSRETHTTRM